LENSSEGDGPKLVSSTPRAEGRLAANRRRVLLQFDDVLDTGAQVLVQFHGADVIAGEPELTNDRRGLVAVIDAEDRGTYEVSWRACSATRKTACSKGTFGFRAPGS
jgi:methionine-rich copper-binding protein CopC